MDNYILPNNAIPLLLTVDEKYKSSKQITTTDDKKSSFIMTLFGATNVPKRVKQLTLLERVITSLQPKLDIAEKLQQNTLTDNELSENLQALRTIIAVCRYIQYQIKKPKKNSDLYKLIKASLGISDNNRLSKEDRLICYSDALELLNKGKLLEGKELEKIQEYLTKKIEQYKNKKPYAGRPVASYTVPIAGTIGAYAGGAIGSVGGSVLSHSGAAMNLNYQLATTASGLIMILVPTASAGMLFIAPMVASQLISNFFSISGGHLCSQSMKVVGEVVGAVIATPFDLAYQVGRIIYSMTSNSPSDQHVPKLTGRRLCDGKLIMSGLVVELVKEGKLVKLPNIKTQYLEQNDKGKLLIDGKELSEEVPVELQNALYESTHSQMDYPYPKIG